MFHNRSYVLAPLLLTALLAAGPTVAEDAAAREATPPFDAEAYVQEVEEWHAERIERLKEPDGWFSLVGLGWLEEGANPIGSADDNKIVMPEKAPARLGVFHLDAGKVQFATASDVQVTHNGEPVKWLKLQSDADGEPTELEAGSFLFYVIRRGEQFGIRVKDRESPALAAFEGIETYPIDPKWRIVGRLEPHVPPRTISVPTVLGTINESPSPGSVVFEIDGRQHRLDALPGGDDGLFMVFADKTNGDTTYGGGRFLYAEIVKGKAVLDFNKAYNPPCAFTIYATCPLPPKQNRLPLRIEAGEKNYGSHH